MTEIVRRALQLYRRQTEQPPQPGFEELLEKTRGIWSEKDGLDYQIRIRSEWEADR
ncbi:hypothetical protein [Methylohalobius crimeensis]|uniref:hypothetical protein n=1 Tax=Methylohalobius crimeensis TaxID=244365 RepID=UPI00040343BE|nr:hypothetical protein [Methylohalobius crimeensis]